MKIDADKSQLTAVTDLRRNAEERLRAKTAQLPLPRTEAEMLRLVHELEVHQIELEMQNAELNQAKFQLGKTLKKYTHLYDFAPVGYFTLGRNGAISAANLTGIGLLRICTGFLGQRFGLFVADEDRLLFADFLDKVFASQGKESCDLALAVEKNRRQFVHIEAVAKESGKECFIAVIDITERKHAEDALVEKRLELEELNRSLETRILAAVDELRQKDQMLILQDRLAIMGEMINNIAHQWRQPLNLLGLVVQQLPLYYDSGDFSREFLAENTAKSMELIQHMSRTIDDFRNFFRSDKEMVPFGVNEVIARALFLVEKSFKDQDVSVVLHLEGDPILTGYPNEYAQVLLNILMNARDALLDRKVVDARISLRVFTEGDRTIVTVTDNAGGIAEEIMGRLFDPYFTTKGPDKGTGIGLFMSKTIIENNMAGSLTVRNTGCGAEFRIEI